MRLAPWVQLALLVPCGAGAQSLDSAMVAEINAATRARLRLHNGGQGVVQKASATATAIGFASGEFLTPGGNQLQPVQPLPLAQISEIQVARGTGALTGFKIGAAAGAALAFLAVALTSGEDYVSLSTGEAAVAIVAWTGIGAGLGALIGSQSTRWHTVYRASAP